MIIVKKQKTVYSEQKNAVLNTSLAGISTPPSQTIVKTGDSATFTCIANATPMPTLSWTKSGVQRSDG